MTFLTHLFLPSCLLVLHAGGGGGGAAAGAAGGVVGAAAFVGAIAFCYCRRRRKQRAAPAILTTKSTVGGGHDKEVDADPSAVAPAVVPVARATVLAVPPKSTKSNKKAPVNKVVNLDVDDSEEFHAGIREGAL